MAETELKPDGHRGSAANTAKRPREVKESLCKSPSSLTEMVGTKNESIMNRLKDFASLILHRRRSCALILQSTLKEASSQFAALVEFTRANALGAQRLKTLKTVIPPITNRTEKETVDFKAAARKLRASENWEQYD